MTDPTAVSQAYRTFGDRLRAELRERNHSQAWFADVSGISQDTLNCYVNARRYPGYQVLLRIIEFLPGVDVAWLVTGQHEERDEEQTYRRRPKPITIEEEF